MNRNIIIALDYSGSVDGEFEYFNFVDNLSTKLENKCNNIMYTCWNTSALVMSRDKFHGIIKNKHCSGGTDPSSIIDIMKRIKFHGDFYLIN